MTNFWGSVDLPYLNDSTRYELGTRFGILAPITVSAIRVFSPPGSQAIGVPRVGRIWDTQANSILASISLPAELTDGWNDYLLDNPLVLSPGQDITVSATIESGYGYANVPGAQTSPDGAVKTFSQPGLYTTIIGTRPDQDPGSSSNYGVDMTWALGAPGTSDQDPVITKTVTQLSKLAPSTVTVEFSTDIASSMNIEWGDGALTAGAVSPASHVYASPGLYALLLTAATPTGYESAVATVVEVLTAPASVDLGIQRKMTEAFIKVKPESIVFTPRTRTRQPAGGWVLTAGAPRDPQTVTFIEMSGLSGTPRPVRTLDGVQREVEMEIVARWDAQIALRDVFEHQGKSWEVVGLFYDNGYELRALISGA